MQNVIEVKNLCKSYNSLNAVCDASFSIKEGEIFGLLGANAAGKTTTIECILGTKKPDGGEVSILGLHPILDRKKLFERVGVQFQDSSYQEKIRVDELCEITCSLYKKSLDYKEILSQFGLSDKLKSYVNSLSGGQRQRLFIVLALIPNPEVIFLDELTTGLDTKARRDVWKYLITLKERGITIFLSSHFMDEVEKLCDKICILQNGKIVFIGTVSEAITTSPYDNLEESYLWYAGEEDGNEII